MRLTAWLQEIKVWQETYNVKIERSFDPTEVRLSCFRCGKLKSKMSRHHTGNDMIFARMLPDHFAARYISFKREDWEKLCNDCHKLAHKIYAPLIQAMWDELNEHGQKIITVEWCTSWKQKFTTAFYDWAKKYKPRKSRRRHK